MTEHKAHNLQLTSFYCYAPSYSETMYNEKFRQEVHKQIVQLLQKHNNLTDQEMKHILGYDDPNRVRPRRYELVHGKFKNHNIIVPVLVEEDTNRVCTVSHETVIAWKLKEDNLHAYMTDDKNESSILKLLGFKEIDVNLFVKEIGDIRLYMDFRIGKRRTWAKDKNNENIDFHTLDIYNTVIHIINS